MGAKPLMWFRSEKSIKLIVGVVIVLAFFLRVWGLNISPPGFNADEAAFGYNAYSILKTGRDEYGQVMPIVFKSFSDYKPGIPVYLTVPFIAIFGLSEFATRLPSVILGTLSVLLIYLLSKKMFKNQLVALSSAILLAISPWHLHYSRGAWETNIATFFMLLGVYAFVQALEKPRWFYVSVISFVLSIYSYQSSRLLSPLLGLSLVIGFWQELGLTNLKKLQLGGRYHLVGAAVLGFILLIPMLLILTGNSGLARFKGVSMFADPGPILRTVEERNQHPNPQDSWSKFNHNSLSTYLITFTSHYLGDFDLNYLFISGDPLKRNKVPEMGQLYLFEIITFFAGIYFLMSRGKNGRSSYRYTRIILFWGLISPVAASLTFQTSYALRSFSLVIPVILISGLGLGLLIEKGSRLVTFWRIPLALAALLLVTISVARYFDNYYIHLPKQYALEWEYGFSQMAKYVLQNQDKYHKVVITDRYDQPYAMMLFYAKYDPGKYQQADHSTPIDQYGFSTVRAFDKYEFRKIDPDEIKAAKDTLFVGTALETANIEAEKVINFPNGTPAFRIISNHE
jgi:4-amino-4-deoxy-L-arabinose transferase-like glycosyltransferase